MEVFTMRSQCAAMAEKILEEQIVGHALTPSQLSHYSPVANRCYVKINIDSGDLTLPESQSVHSAYLYDGQTKEMLAFVANDQGKKTFTVFSMADLNSYDKVATFIYERMNE
jgi:hypothetical protein